MNPKVIIASILAAILALAGIFTTIALVMSKHDDSKEGEEDQEEDDTSTDSEEDSGFSETDALTKIDKYVREMQQKSAQLRKLCMSVSPPVFPDQSLFDNTMKSLQKSRNAMNGLIQNVESQLSATTSNQ